jgi:hypothetical protein
MRSDTGDSKIESQWQVKERDPSATLGQYGGAEKSENEGDESIALLSCLV